MTEWQRLQHPDGNAPYDEAQVLLAVPHVLGPAFGGDGRALDPDHSYSFYIGRWNTRTCEWATTETNEDTNGTYWLCFDEPTHWCAINLPE